MNKIFKVVWSKTKECYVVVSEVAKNNGGKKKVLASVLAGLAMVSIGQVQAAQTQYGSGSTATGAEATAVGVSSTATKSYSTAVGYLNKAEGIASIAAGSNNKVIADAAGVQSDYSYAVGSNNTITGSTYASAFGRENNVVGEGSTALGYNNLVGIDRASGNAIVDAATGAKGAGKATAIGYQSEARGNRNVAIGNQAIAQRDDSVAIGSEVQALSGHNIAIGSKSVAQASTDKASVGIAIGLNVKAVGQSNTDKDLIAIGNSSNATANGAVAIGSNTNATGNNAYAMGNSATASASGAVAIGQVSGATGHGATAFGNGSQSKGIGSTGIGRLSYASENGATAIGANSAATGYNSIAIGADEVTGAGNLDYVNNNFKTPGATADTIGSTRASGKYAVALSTEARASKDDAVAIGHKATASIAGGVALGSESKTTVAAGVTGYNPATGRTNDYKNLTNNTKADLTSTRAAVSIGDDSASVTRQLTGLAAGTQDTDAVNVAQLKAVNLKYAADTGNSDVLLKDGTLTVKGDGDLISTDAQTNGVIKVTAKKGGTITNTDGKAVKPTTNGIATTDNIVDAINNSYWKATAGGNTDGAAAVGNVKPGNQVTYSAGDNLKVKQTIAANGDQEYKYSLNPVLTGITSIANTTTGPKMTFGGSSINITGGNLSLGDGTTNNKIVNVAPGTDDNDAVNVKQLKDTELHITPGTYAPDSNKKVKLTYTDGNNTVVTGKEAVIDLSSLTTGGTTSTEKVQKAADATNDKNIAEVGPKSGDTFGAANATYEVSVSRNAVKDAAREAVTVNNGGTTTGGTYTADTNNPISVTPTEDNTKHNTTYAITFDGNKAAKQIPLTYKANGTGDKTVKLDKGLDFTNGTNTTAEIGNDGVVKFNLNKDVDLSNTGSLTVGGTKVNNGGVTITAPAGGTTTDVKLTNTGLDNGGNKITNVAEGKADTDAVNVKQLKDAKTILKDGKNTTVVGTGTAADPYKVNVEGALTGITSITNDGTNNGKISFGPNKTVTVDGDHSITLNASTGNIGGLQNKTFDPTNFTSGQAATEDQLKSVHDTLKASELHIAPTVIKAGSTEAKGGTANATGTANVYKYDATNKTVTLTYNDGNGTAVSDTKAVIDFSALNTGAGASSWNIASDKVSATEGAVATGSAGTQNIADGKTVTMKAGKNLTVNQSNDGAGNASVAFSLDKNLENLDKVVVNGNDGATGKAGVSIVGPKGANGVDGNDGKVGITGKDGKDAVSISGKDGVGTIGLTGPQGPAGADGKGVDITTDHGTKTLVNSEVNNGDKSERIVYVPKDKDGNPLKDANNNLIKREVATMDDGLKFTGNNTVIENKQKLGSLVKVQGEGTKEGTTVINPTTGEKELVLSDGTTKFESAKDNIAVVADGADTLTVKLNKNLKGLDSVTTKEVKLGDTGDNISIKKDGDRITYTTNNGGTTTTNKVANLSDIWKIQANGTTVEPVNGLVNVKAGDNINITTPTTADGSMTINAVSPVVYTTPAGDKLTKKGNKFYKADGSEYTGGDVIASFENPNTVPAGTTSTTDGTMIVNNVGSAINGQTGTTYLDKLNAAAGDNNTKHAAVNVTDLKNTADALTDKGLKFDANVGGVKTNKLGSIVKVQGAGASADADYSGANIKTFINQTGDNTTIDVKLDKNLAGINSITGDTNSGKLVFQNPTATGNNGDAFKFTGGNINAGGNNITNLKSGIVNNNATDDTNGANIGDVKKIAKDSDLHIAPTAGTTNNVAEYTVDANNKVTLTYQDGNGTAVAAPKAVIDLSALANKITSGYTFNANATANGGTVANDATTPAAVTAVANGGTINYAAGKNLTVKQDIDATTKTHTYTYSLDKDLTNLDKVVVNGKDGISGKDGVTIVGPQGATGATGIPGTNGIDGKVGIAGKDGKDAVSISGKDGVGTIGLTGPQGPAGADGKGVDITTDHGTKTLVNPEVNNGDKSERIVYVPKDKDGNPLKDANNNPIKREVATMDDGLKFTGNNESTENKHKLGSLVKVQGEGVTENTTTNKLEVNGEEFKSASGNIAVVADSIDKLTVKLNKNLAGINKISNGGSSITLNDTPSTTTPAVTISGGDLSMGDGTHNNKIVNVAPGTDDNDAVNYKQLKATKTEVKAGKNVVVTSDTSAADGHTTYTVNASTSAVYTKPDGTKLVKQPDGTFKDENGNAYTGPVIASFEDNNGSTTGGNMIVNNVGSAIKNLGSAGDNYLTKLDLANTATPNAAVNVSDLKNTADALQANERHIAPTTVAAGSTENKGGTTVGTENVYKYDATTKKVTLTYNDGKGNAVTDTKAVIDFTALNTGAGASSWNIASDKVSATEGAVAAGSAGTQNIADGKTVTMKAGKNLTVNQSNDGAGNASVAFSLDKNLENLDKVVVNGNDGTTGKAGVSIVGPKGANGVDGNDGKVGIAGKDGKDAVSISGKDGVGHIGLQGPKGTPGIPGADGANLDITTDHGTQTLVKPEANNNNQSERIVYVPKDANGNPLKDTDGNTIKREVATMDDGLKFTGNNTATENKHKLGSLVKVQGEGVTAADEAAFQSATGNIAVTADGTDTLTIRLNKNLKGLNSIQLGDNTIKSNGDNIEFTTKGGTTKTVATTDQLWTIQANGTDVPATNGKVNVVGKDGITVAKNAAGNLEISGSGLGTMNSFDVTANNGATSKTIDNGKKVDFNATSNLTVKQTSDANGTHIEYALNKDVDLGNTGSLKIGDTTVNNGGLTIANGPSITSTGVDAGSKKITNVADGDVNATSKDAVNGSQLKKYTDAAKTTVEAGDTNVTVDTDNSAADGHTNYKVSLKPVVEIGDTHKVKIDGHTGDITGLTNVTLNDPTFATKGRAATEEQLKQVLTEAKNKAIEKVQAGTAAAGDTNIATVAPKAGDTFGAAGATYEVSVSKNAVKDAAKEAVKVTSASPAITVTPDTSVAHETTYKVGFDGAEAAKSIPLTYKANGNGSQTVTLDKGLDFKNGTNTTARIAPNGQVFYDVNPNLQNISSISGSTTGNGPRISFNNAGANSTVNVDGGNLNMNNNKITNVDKGTDSKDAANVGQLTQVKPGNSSVTVGHTVDPNTGANIYTITANPAGTVDLTNVNNRVDQLGEEIGRVGAQGAALSALKPIQYDPLEPTQIMAGYGNYRGTSAIAMGVAHYKNESTLIHGGISWAGGSSHMMANAGVTWKVGNRDSEAAVADRYRKGPISSTYAMQQEMAAMKAQNAGLKGEVSDLKAENEQMKAQIAAMMAKLGL